MRRVSIFLVASLALAAATVMPARGGDDSEALKALKAEREALRAQVQEDTERLADVQREIDRAEVAKSPRVATTAPAAAKHHSRRIVFAIEARGAMLNHMGDVRTEILNAVDQLAPDQQFTVAVIFGERVSAMSPSLLAPAAGNAAKAAAFLDTITPKGESSHLSGLIAAAAKFAPDRVILITYDIRDERTEIPRMAEIATTHKFRIDSLFFDDGSNNSHDFLALANVTGGTCVDETGKVVTAPPTPVWPRPVPKPIPHAVPPHRSIFEEN